MLTEAESLCNQLKANWLLNKSKLGPMSHNIDASKSLTMTYNNLGVHYKQTAKQNVTVRYLKKVLEIEE